MTAPEHDQAVDQLLARARAWAAADPDPATREQLEREVEEVAAGEDPARLADRFDGTLAFGTAGLRGALGPGPNRMNRVVVARAAAGLAAYLLDEAATAGSGRGRLRVVVGYDARHLSDVFARDTAEVMARAGLEAMILPRPLPTPVLAYAVRELGCAAGVMVTASHNPPEDNGYKVYLGDGRQIVSPADAAIAARIAESAESAESADPRDVARGGRWRTLDEGLVDRYLDTVAALAEDGPRDLDLVYTPLHGVGAAPVLQVLETAGFAAPRVVASQEQPDPDFPTVPFPNPEEPGAMDEALALAVRTGADLVVANDPDADRCAAAVPADTGWRLLHGDEIGALLAHHLMGRGRHGTWACSIVSSSLLARMAETAGERHEQTLTGLKWISRAEDLVFGYEEALGYCCDPGHVLDKDGVSALLLLCELAAGCKAEGRTLLDVLDDLAAEHGLHATDQVSLRVADLTLISRAMTGLREDPPAALGGLAVERVEDLAAGGDGLPPTDALRYRLADGARVVVRPSGTEPKVKAYLEVVVPVEDAAPGEERSSAVAAARIAAATRLDALGSDLRLRLGG